MNKVVFEFDNNKIVIKIQIQQTSYDKGIKTHSNNN